MEAIVKVWFEDNRIYILTDQGNTYSRSLKAFPLLLRATAEQRALYEIGLDGDDIRWEDIDEDIHISSFFVTAEPNKNGDIPYIDPNDEINPSLLSMAGTLNVPSQEELESDPRLAAGLGL